MQQLIADLRAARVSNVLPNEILAHHTTWKIGGPADLMVIPHDKEELLITLELLHRHNVSWMVLGRGSNVLVTDKGVRGVVIKLGNGFEHLSFEDQTVRVGASFSFIKLSVLAAKRGLTGLEFAGGIPGTVGGAVYMNAGAHGSDVSRILKSAEVILENGELVVMNNDQLDFSYRHSLLQERRGIVTEVVFQLSYGDRLEIAKAMAANKDRRIHTQPLQMACAGSVFRNPKPYYAAQLIEEAGLKGTRVGGAEVSRLHANFIVNTGHATAEDVLAVMEKIQKTVFEKYGIWLIPEVLVVGER